MELRPLTDQFPVSSGLQHKTSVSEEGANDVPMFSHKVCVFNQCPMVCRLDVTCMFLTCFSELFEVLSDSRVYRLEIRISFFYQQLTCSSIEKWPLLLSSGSCEERVSVLKLTSSI